MKARTRMEDVEVRRPDGAQYGNGPELYYGQAITGGPIHRARILEAPRDQPDIDWIDNVLATRIAPGGTLELTYLQEN